MEDLTKLDPYRELGVERDASAAVILKAYRLKSMNLHPDTRPRPESEEETAAADAAWLRLQLCYGTLKDPAKRTLYDETGIIGDAVPNNDHAEALGIVQRHFGDILNEYIRAGMQGGDPRQRDIVQDIVNRIDDDLLHMQDALPGGEKIIAFLADMAPRFTRRAGVDGEDWLAASFKEQIADNQRKLTELRKAIEVHRLAISVARHYDFRRDTAADVPEIFRDAFPAADFRPDGRGGFNIVMAGGEHPFDRPRDRR